MIIELSPAFDDFSREQWEPEQHAIERLLTAHANGWHLVSMSRKTAASILQHCELSGLQRAVLRDPIIPRLTNITSQAKSLKYGVICVPDRLHTTASPHRIALPLSYFNNPDASLPAYVIVESIEGDAAFIKFLCSLFGKSLGFSSSASLTFLAGGGGSTANRYQEVADSGRAVLCIVDSDRLFPNGPLGVTARSVVSAEVEMALARSLILPVREIENLIPYETLQLVYSANASTRAHIMSIIDFILSKSNDPSISKIVLGHFDVKNGINRSFVHRVDDVSKNVWIELWAHCQPSEADFSVNDNNGEDIVIAAISARAVSTTIEYFVRNPHLSKTFVKSVRAHPFGANIEDLVSDVLSLTAAADRVRAPLKAA